MKSKKKLAPKTADSKENGNSTFQTHLSLGTLFVTGWMGSVCRSCTNVKMKIIKKFTRAGIEPTT
jgi:hypothetical protein